MEKETWPLRRLWEFAAVIVGIIGTFGATDIFPSLYWVFVILVYVGFAGVVLDAVRGKWHPRVLVRTTIATVGLVALAWWTFYVVLVKADIGTDAVYDAGNYPAGTKLGGKDWNNNLEAVDIYLRNDSDHDYRGVGFTISTDMIISDVYQTEPVCQGFQSFTGESGNAFVELKDQKSGEVHRAPAIDAGLSTRRRVVCDMLPRRSTVPVIVVMLPTAQFVNGQWPKKITGADVPKRPPIVMVSGEFRVLGRTKDFAAEWKSLGSN